MSPNDESSHRAREDRDRQGLTTQHEAAVDGSLVPVPATPPVRTSAVRGRSAGPRMMFEMVAALDRELYTGPGGPGLGGPTGVQTVQDATSGPGGSEAAGPTAGNPIVNGGGSTEDADSGRRLFPALLPPLPHGAPHSFQPQHDRLFTQEQQERLESMQRSAPQLYGAQMVQEDRGLHAGMDHREHLKAEAERLHMQWQLEKEKEEMVAYMRTLHQENMSLRMQLSEERDQRYVTPESVREGMNATERGVLEHQGPDLLQRRRAGGDPQASEAAMGDGFKRSLKMFGLPERPKSPTPQGRPRSRSPSRPSGHKRTENQTCDPTVQTMLKLMEGMQSMQQQILEQAVGKRASGDGYRDDEYVRGSVELHKLPEWSPESAPVDFQDWLLVLHPQMADLSASSGEWWTRIMEVAGEWYRKHQELTPLERLQHEVVAPKELQGTKWARVEKRACSLLLQAIPESQKEDVIASRSLSVLGVITRLMVNYQPGGAHEKAAVLMALESPAEALAVGDAITGLRRWLRRKRRALDINVSLPDPMVLLRGLDKMVGRVLGSNPALQFRLNLVRTTLKVDSMPTLTTVEQLAESTMAELDQLAYSRRKEKGALGNQEPTKPKVKKLEEVKIEDQGQKGFGKGGKTGKAPLCRFFLSDDGCRKGKACRFSHDQKDYRRRCWTCGSPQHMSNLCPLASSNEGNPNKINSPGPKVSKVLRTAGSDDDDQRSEKAVIGKEEDMKSLLEEAGKMLRSMSSSSGGDGKEAADEQDLKIRSLQKQLDDLRATSLKTLRLSRVKADESHGLLDSGATHALRPPYNGEVVDGYRTVKVSLAGNKQVNMKMSPANVIIGDSNVEPIVPMGSLINDLGCTMQWSGDHLVVHHPVKGMIPTFINGGCPMVEREQALELIAEMEGIPGVRSLELGEREVKSDPALMEWLERLSKEHPAFQGIPERLRRELVMEPRHGHLAGNKRLRQYWRKNQNLILHLYAGPDKDYTFKQAAREMGADERQVLEVDVLRGDKWDMVGPGLYTELLQMACDGWISGVLGGPNCRTRSRLRHQVREGLPGPVRAWKGGEWGLEGLSSNEMEKCHNDDLMILRMNMIYIVAEEVRRATKKSRPVAYLMEHPAAPMDLPEVVSWWKTPQWRALKNIYSLAEVTLDQGEAGGLAHKPTTLGTNVEIDIRFPTDAGRQRRAARVDRQNLSNQELVDGSKRLARWTPMLMMAIAEGS